MKIILSSLLCIILLITAVALLSANQSISIVKPVTPPDSTCDIKKLWPLTPGHTNAKKYLEVPGAGEVTFSGKVMRAGVDGDGHDCDSTFEFVLATSDQPRLETYCKKITAYKILNSALHCEIIVSCPSGNDSIYKKCSCIKPRMPMQGDSVQVTGKLIVDLHHVDTFPTFELHPVERIFTWR
jgi:hypothetical protein